MVWKEPFPVIRRLSVHNINDYKVELQTVNGSILIIQI